MQTGYARPNFGLYPIIRTVLGEVGGGGTALYFLHRQRELYVDCGLSSWTEESSGPVEQVPKKPRYTRRMYKMMGLINRVESRVLRIRR